MVNVPVFDATSEQWDFTEWSAPMAGDGFPEGKVTAPVGSIYTDRQATAGAVRWVKTSGTGTTGWQVEYGDTGWRSITVEGLFSTGKILVRRINGTIYLNAGEGNFRLFTLADQSDTHMSAIPPSFRPEGTEFLAVRFDSGKGLAGVLEVGRSGYVSPRMVSEYVDLSTLLQAETASWPAPTLWPATLPGTPA